MDTKKKITYGLMAVVLAFFGWQAFEMFGGRGDDMSQGPIIQKNPDTPEVGSLMPPQQKATDQKPITEREAQLIKLQQETQAKYIAAVNELQMLKIEKDIAETSRDVSKAKLEGITAQKGIVDLLTPEKVAVATPATYAQGLLRDSARPPSTVTDTTDTTKSDAVVSPQSISSDSYTVVSISKLRGQWIAVLGYAGTLYKVSRGDVLPNDGSVVTSIDRNGIKLEKDGKTIKVSMVPII